MGEPEFKKNTFETEKTEVEMVSQKFSWFGPREKGPRLGLLTVAGVAFIEAALPVPILTDPFLAAAVLSDRTRTVKIVLVTTAASVLGGVTAFLSAKYFFEVISRWLSASALEQFDSLVQGTDSSILVLTLIGAMTPVPYTFSAWAAAILQGSLFVFIFGSVVGRGVRYAIVGYCVHTFGRIAGKYIKQYLGILTVGLMLVGVLYFFLHFY